MATVVFTTNLRRHVECPDTVATGTTVREVLSQVFAMRPRLEGYVVDERGVLRKHMTIFVDGQPILDRVGLSDAVSADSEVYVMQALSGG